MQAIRRGDIFHRYFTTTTPPKDKFFIVIGEDEGFYVGYFFINSNINDYALRNDMMRAMQLPIKPSDYPFLSHLSFVAGHQLSKLSKRELLRELYSGKAQYKGRLSDWDMEMLLGAALNSPLFSEREKEFFR